MYSSPLLLAAVASLLFLRVDSARILGVFPHTGKSHFDVFEPLMVALAERGHQVTVISYFPQKTKIQNYTDISLQDVSPLYVNALPFEAVANSNPISEFIYITTKGLNSCDEILGSKPVQDLLRSDNEFDLLIIELFNIDCFLGFVHRYKVPYIGLSSSNFFPTHNDRTGNPDNPSYIPNLFFPFSDKMTFVERILNTWSVMVMKFIKTYYFDVTSYKIASKYFGSNLPSLESIAKNVSLVLVNTHYSLNRPRPLVPAVIQVGGLHLKEPSRLPAEIEKLLNDSTNGAVVFSMGSVLRSETFPPEKRQAFLDAFEELPQNFIMKWENTTVPGKPKNVFLSTWLPQRDILEHPNVVAIIAHGGLLGTSEAMYCGVPIIMMPMFGDQSCNVAAVVSLGAGLKLPFSSITKENVLKALVSVISDPSFRQNAQKVSAAYRDRPSSPLQTAIFWTEYVLRHQGAPLMRSAAVYQPWYQHVLLDVIIATIIILVLTVMVVFFVAKKITVFLVPVIYSSNKYKKDV